MIAEYRRIMKNPTPERRKKCIFFDAIHRIYQAKDTNSLENVILTMGYMMDNQSGNICSITNDQYNFDPLDFSNIGGNGGGGSHRSRLKLNRHSENLMATKMLVWLILLWIKKLK